MELNSFLLIKLLETRLRVISSKTCIEWVTLDEHSGRKWYGKNYGRTEKFRGQKNEKERKNDYPPPTPPFTRPFFICLCVFPRVSCFECPSRVRMDDISNLRDVLQDCFWQCVNYLNCLRIDIMSVFASSDWKSSHMPTMNSNSARVRKNVPTVPLTRSENWQHYLKNYRRISNASLSGVWWRIIKF